MSVLIILSVILSYLITGFIGYIVSYKFKLPVPVYLWIIILLLTCLAYFSFIGTSVISIFNFAIKLNWCLQGLGLGILVGLFIRTFKSKPVKV